MEWVERYPGTPFYLMGGLFLTLSGAHTAYSNTTITVMGFKSFIPLLLAGGIVYAGYQFRTLSPSSRLVGHAELILLIGAVFGGSVAGFIVWIESPATAGIAEYAYPVIAASAAGTLLASPIAYYYVSSTNRLTELETQYAHADRMRKQLSVLDRVLRHNLRNELNVISGWLEETTQHDDPAAHAIAHRVIDDHLTRLEALSDTARTIRQVFETEVRETFDLSSVVAEVHSEIRAREPSVTLESDVPSSATVRAVPQLPAAVRELHENAIEHNDPETLTVAVAVTSPGDRGDAPDVENGTWCIEVRDTGEGIPVLEKEALGQPDETPLCHGRGLGLWLVYAVVDRSGGHVAISSTERYGTVFSMWLPRADVW